MQIRKQIIGGNWSTGKEKNEEKHTRAVGTLRDWGWCSTSLTSTPLHCSQKRWLKPQLTVCSGWLCWNQHKWKERERETEREGESGRGRERGGPIPFMGPIIHSRAPGWRMSGWWDSSEVVNISRLQRVHEKLWRSCLDRSRGVTIWESETATLWRQSALPQLVQPERTVV